MSSGFRRAGARRQRPAEQTVVATFAAFEVRLLRQLVGELVMLLQAEVGAGARPPGADGVDDPGEVDDFAAIAAQSGLAGLAGTDEDLLGPVHAPEDPVLARLFPNAYEDEESAGDFRRFTQDRLVDAKHRSAQTVLALLDDVATAPVEEDGPRDQEPHDQEPDVELELHSADAMHWLRTLNDVRLALGTRLGVEQDDDAYWAALPADDPRATVHEIYQWLGWLQETLVAALPKPR